MLAAESQIIQGKKVCVCVQREREENRTNVLELTFGESGETDMGTLPPLTFL